MEKLTDTFYDTSTNVKWIWKMLTEDLAKNPPLTDKEYPKLYKITITVEECENPLTILD